MATDYNYIVQGVIPAIAQGKQNGCWAASATMLISWRDQASYEIETVISMIGDKWLQKFRNETGLEDHETDIFLADSHFQAEPAANYTLEELVMMMQNYGPLMITTATGDADLTHVQVLFGISGNGTVDNTKPKSHATEPVLHTAEPAYRSMHDRSPGLGLM